MIDGRHVRLGADVWGTLYTSKPIEVDYSQVHTLVVSDSALFPTGDPSFAALPASEAERLRRGLRVELDGSVAIEASCYAFEAGPSEIYVGRAPFGSTSAAKFTGGFIEARRLPIPRLASLPSGDSANLILRFPRDRVGLTESLAAFRSEMGTLSYAVTYVGPGRLRITASGPDGQPQSAEFDADLAASHTMSFIPSEPAAPRQGFDLSCAFDGRPILGGAKPIALPVQPQLSTGVNPWAAHASPSRFSGPELDLELASGAPAAGPAEGFGPVHLILTLPSQRTGRHEPLLTTGRTGAGDVIYVFYEDAQHIRVGFDHWSYGGKLSDPIAVDYMEPHEVWILEGALFPALGDDAKWGATKPATRKRLKSLVAVMVDGKPALLQTSETYPSSAQEVSVAKNRIGASTADVDFSGVVSYSERTGTFVPPDLGF
jgi:hypothetical protein